MTLNDSSQAFIKGLLTENVKERMSAQQAMDHEFITSVSALLISDLKEDEIAKNNLKQLLNFRPYITVEREDLRRKHPKKEKLVNDKGEEVDEERMKEAVLAIIGSTLIDE
jgi:serine/threonine protein kinase